MAGEYRAPTWFSNFVKDIEHAFKVPRGQGKLVRPRHPRLVAGVCSGIAEHYAWNLSILRVLVVIFTVATSGALILAYAAAWVLIPEGTYALPQDAGAGKL